MPQKRKKHSAFGGCSTQSNDNNINSNRNAKSKQVERHCEKKSDAIAFTNDQLQEVKTILKRKHLGKTPAIINATVLNKTKLIEDILKRGDDVNERDETGATALIWGVRTKTLDGIKSLLKAENICLKTDGDDHALFLALNSTNWNESEFYNLWTNVKALHPVGVNILSNDGRSMLHYAVAREWMGFINVLIAENADVNIQDTNGLTPLMLACVNENLRMVEYFLEHNIDVTAEDSNGLTTLCYLMWLNRRSERANVVVGRFLNELEETVLRNYIKSRLDLVLLTNLSINLETSKILSEVFKYVVHREDTCKYLLETNVLGRCKEAICSELGDLRKLRFALKLTYELYKQKSRQKEIVSALIAHGCLEAFALIVQKYKLNGIETIGKIALKAIVNIATSSDDGKLWLEVHYKSINEIIKTVNEDDLCKILNVKDETWNHDPSKTRQFVEYMDELSDGGIICGKQPHVIQQLEENSRKTTKKNKRRTKLTRLKLQSEKNAESEEIVDSQKIPAASKCENKSRAERGNDLNVANGKEFENSVRDEREDSRKFGPYFKICLNPNGDEKNVTDEDCTLVNAIKSSILTEDVKSVKSANQEERITRKTGDWRTTITNLPFAGGMSIASDVVIDVGDFNAAPRLYSHRHSFNKDDGVPYKFTAIIDYLCGLLDNIVREYNVNWEIDDEIESKVFNGDQHETEVQRRISRMKADKIEMLKTVFNDMIQQIRITAGKNYAEGLSMAKNLEKLLMDHEIRGKTMKEDVAASKTIELIVNYLNNYSFIPNYTLENYMEDVLNKKRDVSESIIIDVKEPARRERSDSYKADMLYLQEMLQLSPKKPVNVQKMNEAKMETLKLAYHLVGPIMKLCDSDDETCFDDPVHKLSPNNSLPGCSKNLMCNMKSREDSRWCSLVRSLELMKDCQTLLNGNVRISCQRKRTSHAISTGGNFTPVELGLDKYDAPLAVKRIPQGSSVCTMIKELTSKLLDLRYVNILHYCVCDYDKNELILATPLCEYNIGQYLMLMKQKEIVSLTTLDIVTQFLKGLRYLHTHEPHPIIHGNLKPSNIFIDLNGNVKLAEFGIHHALFKFKEAPNSSVIWFSTETYKNFNDTSIMECTLESDIQVTGMLMHFIITGGTHAFGVETKEILKNLEKATPKLICNDIELQDLLTWMLLIYPNERPTIQQILSHVYFWSMEKKWQFILTCCGVTSSGADLLMDLDGFHYALDQISRKENIKGNWVQVMKRLIPNLTNSDDDDSPTGLLKFIRSCYKIRPPPIEFTNDFERCNFFIKSFPTLALSLYRMLENTEWLSHSVFSLYTVQQ